jgi:hypothetical protein
MSEVMTEATVSIVDDASVRRRWRACSLAGLEVVAYARPEVHRRLDPDQPGCLILDLVPGSAARPEAILRSKGTASDHLLSGRAVLADGIRR